MEYEERLVPEISPKDRYKEHITRYLFARDYVQTKTILDIACGSGYGANYLAQNGAKFVVGIDISEKAIAHAKKHYKASNLRFLIGDATCLALKNNSFDVVVSFETLEHIPEYKKYLKETYRVLKPNGPFIVSTPNKKFFPQSGGKPANPYHAIELSLGEFQELLTKQFREITIYGQDYQGLKGKIKSMIPKIVPKIIKQKVIPKQVRESYAASLVSGITNKDVENCKFLIGVCVK